MREEIQKMNEALRATVQLQSQMAAQQRQAVNKYSPTTAGLAQEIRDRVATRGGPTSNVYSIGTGAPVPPSNINPTGSPLGMPTPNAAWQILNQPRFASSYAGAMANQATFGTQSSVREREELVKALGSQADKSFQVMRGLLLQQTQKFSDLEKTLSEQTAKLEIDPQTGKILTSNTSQLEELNKTIRELNKTNSELASVQAAAADKLKAAPPGGGDGGNGSWWNKYSGAIGRGASGLAMALGTGFQLAGTYSNLQAMGFNQNIQALQAIPQNIATAESLRYQKYMATVAPTTGDQFLEAYGNLLTPNNKKFSYLGVGNRQSLKAEADVLVQEELKASEAERKSVVRGSIGNSILQGALSIGAIVGGIGLTAGTAGVGALPGIALAGTGVAGLVNAGKDLYTNITGAQTGLAGQAEGGIFDVTGAGLIHEGAKDKAKNVQAMYQSGLIRRSEEIQRMYMESEKSRFDARRLSMGIDENLAAFRMQTAATSMAGGAAVTGFEVFQNKNLSDQQKTDIANRYARLGYSIPEVGQIYNTYAGMTGTTQGAGKLLGLSRAGVGSVEQMASNVLGISAVSGKQGDLKQLENIFAKAFETGLKGAPSIQRFSQAAMEMSAALKLQSATGAAGFMSTLTGAMAGKTGSAAMYMEEAKSGLAGLAATTGATTGLMGTLKVLSGAGMGLKMGTGLGFASRSNIVQVQDALQQLEAGGDYTKMTGLARKMIGTQIASGMTEKEAIEKTRKSLQGQLGAQAAPFAGEYKRRTGVDLSATQAEAKTLLTQSRNKDPKIAAKAAEQLKNLMFKFEEQTTGMAGLEAEGSAAALLLAGVPAGDFKRGKQILTSEKAKGAAKAAADFSTVNYKRVLNAAAVDASKGISRVVTDEELKTTAAGMGINVKGDKWKQELAKAAGVDLTKGEKFTFGKLATAMSTYADKDTQRTSMSIIEAFGPIAIDQLAKAVRGTSAGGKLSTGAGVGATSIPTPKTSTTEMFGLSDE
jgi:hypothetical protein